MGRWHEQPRILGDKGRKAVNYLCLRVAVPEGRTGERKPKDAYSAVSTEGPSPASRCSVLGRGSPCGSPTGSPTGRRQAVESSGPSWEEFTQTGVIATIYVCLCEARAFEKFKLFDAIWRAAIRENQGPHRV